MSAEDILNTINDQSLSLANKSANLMKMALRAGGYDNITFVLVKKDKGDRYGK